MNQTGSAKEVDTMRSQGKLNINPEKGKNKGVIIFVVFVIIFISCIWFVTHDGGGTQLEQTPGHTTSITPDPEVESE